MARIPLTPPVEAQLREMIRERGKYDSAEVTEAIAALRASRLEFDPANGGVYLRGEQVQGYCAQSDYILSEYVNEVVAAAWHMLGDVGNACSRMRRGFAPVG